jgi:hypothetical protein
MGHHLPNRNGSIAIVAKAERRQVPQQGGIEIHVPFFHELHDGGGHKRLRGRRHVKECSWSDGPARRTKARHPEALDVLPQRLAMFFRR